MSLHFPDLPPDEHFPDTPPPEPVPYDPREPGPTEKFLWSLARWGLLPWLLVVFSWITGHKF